AKAGDRLLVDDGRVGLQVTEIDENDVVCEVTEGGEVSDHKGVSLPGMDVSVPALTDKDVADRKSTRLNSSHGSISYAVFSLKKTKLLPWLRTGTNGASRRFLAICARSFRSSGACRS